MSGRTILQIMNQDLPETCIIVLAHKLTLISWNESRNILYAWKLKDGHADVYVSTGAKALTNNYTVPELVIMAKAFVFDNTLHGQ